MEKENKIPGHPAETGFCSEVVQMMPAKMDSLDDENIQCHSMSNEQSGSCNEAVQMMPAQTDKNDVEDMDYQSESINNLASSADKKRNQRGAMRPTHYSTKLLEKRRGILRNKTAVQDDIAEVRYDKLTDVTRDSNHSKDACKNYDSVACVSEIGDVISGVGCSKDDGKNSDNIEVCHDDMVDVITDGDNNEKSDSEVIDDESDLISDDGNINNNPEISDDENNPDSIEDDDDVSDTNSESDDCAETDDVSNMDTPLQPGHYLTVAQAVLLVWTYVVNHSLTKNQFEELLGLINILLLVPHPAFKSVYRFKKFFANPKVSEQKHYFCGKCNMAVDKECKFCPNTKCRNSLQDDNARHYSIEIPLVQQLSNLFTQTDFVRNLYDPNFRTKRNEDNIEDVYDSAVYKSVHAQNSTEETANKSLSFSLNTDGIPVFKSSKRSLWPIFIMINDLPFIMRKQRRYMLLAGLWFCNVKTDMNLFFRPTVETLRTLATGVCIKFNNSVITVKGFVHALVCDIPARSTSLNMNQHNGDSCCPKCLQTGQNHRTDTGGNIRIFPYDLSNADGPKRVHEESITAAQKCLVNNKTVNGIKGPTMLALLPKFNLVKGVSIDYMHGICLGVVKTLLKLWFSVSNRSQSYSLYKNVALVDRRIDSIKPSYLVSRKPRNISDHLKFWKAAELRSWLLYYSLPCIFDMMQPAHLFHYAAFVEAIYLLSSASISKADLDQSEKLLNYFVFMFSPLYGCQYMTINIHSLLHLSDTVRQLGPLWSTSCFAFESANGELLKLYNGTQFIDNQICNAIQISQQLPGLLEKISDVSPASRFISKLCRWPQKTFPAAHLVGVPYSIELNHSLRALICGYIKSPITENLRFYKRAVIRGIYQSKEYTRVRKRNSFTIKFVLDNHIAIGQINWFGVHKENKFVCINNWEPTGNSLIENLFADTEIGNDIATNFIGLSLPKIHFVKPTPQSVIISLDAVLDLCICIECPDKNLFVVCEEPNNLEHNL